MRQCDIAKTCKHRQTDKDIPDGWCWIPDDVCCHWFGEYLMSKT